MSTRSEALFASLLDPLTIPKLIGRAEDADVDFKQWRSQQQNTGSLAKAACAFANATGGVIVIGVVAASPRNGEPDVATGTESLSEAENIKALAIDIIAKQVDPGFSGLEVEVVPDVQDTAKGYVIVHVPEAALPQRSRVDRHFYTRIGARSIPMEMYQIADRFGRRSQPSLRAALVEVNPFGTIGYTDHPSRTYKLVITNEGRGVAMYPAIFFAPGTPLNTAPFRIAAWPFASGPRPSYRGGANDVIYPGETKKIVELYQAGIRSGPFVRYSSLALTSWVVCSEMAQYEQVHVLSPYDSSEENT